MGKILYPVGTRVTLRKFPDTEGLIVSKYIKGEKYPYRVGYFEGDEVSVEGKSKFSKAGLKRSNPKELRSADSVDVSPTQAKVAEASPTASAPMNCNCYTKEEVDVLLTQQWKTIVQMLSSVDGVATGALNNTLMIAEVLDHNFEKVAKQFKTLNHDDD